jgi:L-lactate utilization protein LutC
MAIENALKKEPNGQSKFGVYILKHKMVFTLLLIIVIISLWAFIKIGIIENQYKKEFLKMKSDYENKMDSITAKQLMLSSKVFSWAIRSELTRENKEQVNQFFLNFIKEPGVSKVEFVNASDAKVALSTNKKDEGTTFTDQVAIMTTQTINYRNDSVLTIVSPVMGLSNKLGVLVIEYNLTHK